MKYKVILLYVAVTFLQISWGRNLPGGSARQRKTENLSLLLRALGLRSDNSGGCSAVENWGEESSYITLPSYNELYDNDLHCEWLLTTPSTNSNIRLDFLYFDVEYEEDCAFDYVEVFDGSDATAPSLGKFCGDQVSSVISSGPQMFMVFHTDEDATATGFFAEFYPNTGSSLCPADSSLSGSGVIKFPEDEHNYADDDSCVWTLTVPAGEVVQLTFTHMDIEMEDDCSNDYVTIYDGDTQNEAFTLGVFCGASSPPAITGTTNVMTIKFTSDESVVATGFIASFTGVASSGDNGGGSDGGETDCPQVVSTGQDAGYLALPATGVAEYDNDMKCQWTISVSAGKRVHLLFESFSIEEEGNCEWDSLTIYDGDSTSNFLDKLCGHTVPNPIKSTGKDMTLAFSSDNSVTDTGFRVRYSAEEISSGGGGGSGGSSGPVVCGTPAFTPTRTMSRIVGGIEAREHSWPWMVSIRTTSGFHFCGGSILSEQWIVSAAHCFSNPDPTAIVILAGAHLKAWTASEATRQIVQVEQIINHESYTGTGTAPDIALLKLKTPFIFNKAVSPVCIPKDNIPDTASAVATGWGDTKNENTGEKLMQVVVPVLAHDKCTKTEYYGSQIKAFEICAGYDAGGKDSCQGDSGGPLVSLVGEYYELHGITSWGYGCAMAKKPGIYTRVGHNSVRSWIANKAQYYSS